MGNHGSSKITSTRLAWVFIYKNIFSKMLRRSSRNSGTTSGPAEDSDSRIANIRLETDIHMKRLGKEHLSQLIPTAKTNCYSRSFRNFRMISWLNTLDKYSQSKTPMRLQDWNFDAYENLSVQNAGWDMQSLLGQRGLVMVSFSNTNTPTCMLGKRPPGGMLALGLL